MAHAIATSSEEHASMTAAKEYVSASDSTSYSTDAMAFEQYEGSFPK
ncbi:hypothetical protein PR001_g4584 [Phytophthora rubi]|uniref:Uncharacterized protein n=1 Tax=Phytophthora rubi TaxID=129364 RepID=A0A6A3NT26_9STRA|nr:hypothetical protein PR001_g4584 [Phytophthora rubi]